MTLSALIPFRAGDPHHDRNWAWTKARWEALLPEVELVVETDDGGASPAEFNHPLALNRAAARAKGDTFVVADIDIVPDPDWIMDAVRLVREGCPWVHTSEYWKLGRSSSERLLQQDPAGDAHQSPGRLTEPPILSSCAPPFVIPREAVFKAGGWNNRIAFWGADDGIFRIAVDTLWGRMERLAGTAVHLWHPEVPFAHERQDEQQALLFEYLDASGDPERIRELQAA